MLRTVPLLSTTSRSSALSWALCPISFGSAVFKLGAKTSDGHQRRVSSLIKEAPYSGMRDARGTTLLNWAVMQFFLFRRPPPITTIVSPMITAAQPALFSDIKICPFIVGGLVLFCGTIVELRSGIDSSLDSSDTSTNSSQASSFAYRVA